MTEDTNMNDDINEELAAIAFVGNALSPFFLEDPEKGNAQAAYDALASLDAAVAATEWPFVDDGKAEDAFELITSGLENGTDETLMWEFRRLFVGPQPKVTPPWGSCYTDYEGVIFGASTLALMHWMEDKGIERNGSQREPEDHIGFMLGLMSWLAENQPGLLDEYLSEHLLTWTPHFLDEVHDLTNHDFYRGIALLTKESLVSIGSARGLSVTEPKFYR